MLVMGQGIFRSLAFLVIRATVRDVYVGEGVYAK